MKRFIVKTAIYVATLFSVVFLYTWYEVSLPANLPFTTNSVSFNIKAKFIMEHQSLLNKSKVIVIGSSMSLNNLDCSQFRDSLNIPVINLSSWGMRMSDFNEFDVWKRDKIILTNMNFPDFGSSIGGKKMGYPYTANTLIQVLNTLLDYSTYRSFRNECKDDTSDLAKYTYENLKFDATGTALLSDSNFNINKYRWNAEYPDYTNEQFTDLLNTIKSNSIKVKKMIICFSPCRAAGYSNSKAASVLKFENAVNKACPNVIFLNYYDVKMPDNDFVDKYHFNCKGARLYTQKIIHDLKVNYGLTQWMN